MSSDEKTSVPQNAEENASSTTTTAAAPKSDLTSEAIIEQERSEKILRAKELYSHGSRNFLVKSYAEAADELSEVCALYGELYGELSDELGMPYLLYAKSLIALALDENKVIDVPDEEEEDDDDGEEEEAEAKKEEGGNKESTSDEVTNGEPKKVSPKNGKELDDKKEDVIADSTAKTEEKSVSDKKEKSEESSSTDDNKTDDDKKQEVEKKSSNGQTNGDQKKTTKTLTIDDGEKPSTSNGEANGEDLDEENDATSNLQLAWEILELASKIFTRQGERGLANLAEVDTELGNIEFENNILEAAREDYDKALFIYKHLPQNYRRAMAEIHYKIGLTFLMQQQNQDGANALKEACNLIAGEIDEIKAKPELSEKDKNNIQDMEETKQEIEAKITEIEETQAQNIAEVRAALDSYIKPLSSGDVDAGSSKSAAASAASSKADGLKSSSASSSSAGATSSSSLSKPTDISHLIKRKKPEEPTSEAEVVCSPAKRPAQ